MGEEWPKVLLELFDDPLLDGVRLKAKPLTADDRLVAKLLEVTDWVEANGREPQRDGSSLKEKLLAASLLALRQRDAECLKTFDRLNLLA